MTAPHGDAYAARQEANDILDAFEIAPRSEWQGLALAAIRADPTQVDGYLAAADSLPQGSTEAATAWLAAQELARLEAGGRLEADKGHLWSSLHARAYLRASAGYAACCFDRREFEAAIAQCRRLLILDIEDHLHVAPLLGISLLWSGDLAGFEALRNDCEADWRPQWLYVDAFHAATAKLPARDRNPRIDRAIFSNRYVPEYLLSAETNADGIDHYAPGSGEEALAIGASRTGRLWRSRPAALRVLAGRVGAICK